jgi:hypothetical protein
MIILAKNEFQRITIVNYAKNNFKLDSIRYGIKPNQIESPECKWKVICG